MTTATMTTSAETNSATVIDSSETSELNTLRNMILMKRSGLRKRQPGFAFFDLPLHIQAKITKMCLHDNPSFRFVLERAPVISSDRLRKTTTLHITISNGACTQRRQCPFII